jgi:hypothetical protein
VLRSGAPGGGLTDYVGLFFTDRNGGIVTTWSYLSPPSAPVDLRVTSVTAHAIDIAWTWNNGGDDEDGFRVSFSGKRGGQVDSRQALSLGADARAASLTDLLSGYDYTISVVAFNAAGESASSNVVTATTPIIPETVRVNLQRVQITEGPIPYQGKYPPFGSVQPGHLLQITLPPQGSVVAGLEFVKSGHSSQECGNPNAVVVLSAGQSTTTALMTAIYGVSKPTYSSTSPVPFVACLLSPQGNPQLPDFVGIDLTIISDVG